jgi:hypothetical protein
MASVIARTNLMQRGDPYADDFGAVIKSGSMEGQPLFRPR